MPKHNEILPQDYSSAMHGFIAVASGNKEIQGTLNKNRPYINS